MHSNNFEKSALFSEVVIPTAQTKYGMGELECLLDSHCDTPRMIIVSGEPGTGKTILLKTFVARNKSKYATEEQHKNVIMLNVSTQNKSCDDLAVEILKQLGDIAPTLGTFSKKKLRIEKLLSSLNVMLIIIDEFHDLIPKSKMDGNNKVIRFIKWLLLNNTHPVSLVLAGCTEIEELIYVDSQIETRCNDIIKMKSYKFKTPEDQSEFMIFLKSLFSHYPIPLSFSLDQRLIYKRFILASLGNSRILTAFLKRSIELSKSDNPVTLQILEEAWFKTTTEKTKSYIKIRPFSANELTIDKALNRLGIM